MKKRKKSIGTLIVSTLILIALVPIVTMFYSSLRTSTRLLVERNEVSQVSSAKTVLETKKDKAIVIYLAFQPYVLPIVSMYN